MSEAGSPEKLPVDDRWSESKASAVGWHPRTGKWLSDAGTVGELEVRRKKNLY